MTRHRTLWIPPRLCAAIRHEARAGGGVTACVERAWKIAWPRLAALFGPEPLEQNFEYVPHIPERQYTHPRAEEIFEERFAGGELEALELELDGDLFDDMTDESYRLARSLAWLVERAWCIALDVKATAAWFATSELAGDTHPMPRAD